MLLPSFSVSVGYVEIIGACVLGAAFRTGGRVGEGGQMLCDKGHKPDSHDMMVRLY